FALPGALDLLRSLRDEPDEPEVAVLAATDPANPYGAALQWPPFAAQAASGGQARGPDAAGSAGRGQTRAVGATVILVNGRVDGYLARGERQLVTYLPDAEPERSRVGRALARVLIERARTGGEAPRGMLIEEIDGGPANLHPLARLLVEAGFIAGGMGLQPTFSSSRQSPIPGQQSSVPSRPSPA